MKILILSLMVAVLSACDRGEDDYTLYKSSVGRDLDRNEVARFNVKERIVPDYNLGHCEKAAELFQNQPGTAVEFWCEPGNVFFIR